MKYLKISNSGEVDILAFTKIGLSSKREDNSKIGMFGSGASYAIAYLIRNNYKFKIFSGTKEIIFETISTKFREQDVQFITINGQETSYSTEMGPQWKLWEAIRELYVNAIDEESGYKAEVDIILPTYNETHIYIEINENIREVLNKWNEYFSIERTDALLEGTNFKIFEGDPSKLRIYKRGMLVYSMDVPSVFHYQLDNITINESRSIKNSGDLYYELAKILSKYLTEPLIEILIKSMDNTFENRLYWDWYSISFNGDWKNYFKDKKIVEQDQYEDYVTPKNKKNLVSLPTTMVKELKTKKEFSHIANELSYIGRGSIIPIDKIEGFDTLKKDFEFIKKHLKYKLVNTIKGVIGNNDWDINHYKRTIYITNDFYKLPLKKRIYKLILENEKIKIGFNPNSQTQLFQEKLVENLLTKFQLI